MQQTTFGIYKKFFFCLQCLVLLPDESYIGNIWNIVKLFWVSFLTGHERQPLESIFLKSTLDSFFSLSCICTRENPVEALSSPSSVNNWIPLKEACWLFSYLTPAWIYLICINTCFVKILIRVQTTQTHTQKHTQKMPKFRQVYHPLFTHILSSFNSFRTQTTSARFWYMH